MLFHKMVEKGVLSLKAKADITPYMENHPKYCPFHCLIGHALEDCREFRSWMHKAAKSGLINLVEEYFELSSTCYALTVKERNDDGCNCQNEVDELRMINNVRRVFEQPHGTRDKGKEKAIDINEEIV